MKVFITGATGFLGSVLAKSCLDTSIQVKALRRPTSHNHSLQDVNGQIEWVEGSLDDVDLLSEAFRDVQVVFHCAAFLGFDGNSSKELLQTVNVEGTAHVVNAALSAGISRLVHISSIAAIGRSPSNGAEIDESTEWVESTANTAYAQSKHLAEMEVYRGIAEGLDAVIINPSLIMGPGKRGENTMQIAERLFAGRLAFMPNGGTNVVDVEDVALAAIAAMEQGVCGERYIVGGHNMMWREILPALALALDVPSQKKMISPRALLYLARISEAWGKISHSKPTLSKEAATTSSSTYFYSNAKTIANLGSTFRPFSETALRIAEAVKNEN